MKIRLVQSFENQFVIHLSFRSTQTLVKTNHSKGAFFKASLQEFIHFIFQDIAQSD